MSWRRRRRSAHLRPTSVTGVFRVGDGGLGGRDLYHALLTMEWRWFFGLLALSYVIFNLTFALLYLIEPGSIGNAKGGSFTDAFFFSVQTMATIGFGVMHPATFYANLVVTVEALLGLVGFALATGLIFARFSRPTARVLFSRVAVITHFDGVPTLMFRCANERRNLILEAQLNVALAREEVNAEGMQFRRFYDLRLARGRNPLFSFTWTAMHPVDAASPLHGANAASLAAQDAGIVVTLTGVDESLSQTIFAQHTYGADEILWGREFIDILSRMDDGTRVVDYRRFHDTVESVG